MLSRVKDYIIDDEFRIILFENRFLAINFIKMLSLEDSRVSLKTNYGRVIIKGRDFSLQKLLDNEILIGGVIDNVEVSYE